MAKFEIAKVIRPDPKRTELAKREPAGAPPPDRSYVAIDSSRMRDVSGRWSAAVHRPHRGVWSPCWVLLITLCFLAVTTRAHADDAIPDVPPRKSAPVVGPAHFLPTSNLDGFYIWLGPTLAASHLDGELDSTFGGELAIVRVKEQHALAVLGGSVGASKWTTRDGGHVWLDAVVGTRALGPAMGLTVGPFIELAELAHPRLGASIGVWMFTGVTPFVRVGVVQDSGVVAEVGLHIALPVFRTPKSRAGG